MARLASDGFDYYSAGNEAILGGKWDIGSGNYSTNFGGRFGGSALWLNSTPPALKNFGSNETTLFIHVAHIFVPALTPGGTAVNAFVQFRDGATAQLSICFTNGGTIEIRSGGITGTLQATFAGAHPGNGIYNGFVFKVVINNTTGSVECRRDGATSNTFAATNINTRGGTSNNYANTIVLSSNASNNTAFDDFVLWNTTPATGELSDWSGELRVETLYPNADTAQKDFSRSTGSSNFALVDESKSNSDTDYVFSSTVNHKDLYDLTNLSSTPANIYGVEAHMFARKTDAGLKQSQIRVKSGATEVGGTDTVLTTSYVMQSHFLSTDPDTGVAWTATAINALQVGPKVTA